MADITSTGPASMAGGAREDGILVRAFRRIVEAREMQARRTVNAYLLTLDDVTLARLGHDRRTLEREAAGGHPYV